MRPRIGTSGYSYPGPPPKGWHALFYPEIKGRQFDEIGAYAAFFDTVEINTTFYRPPAATMAEAWVKKTPRDFRFAVKVWQKFTHPMKLGEGAVEAGWLWDAPGAADVEVFRKGIEALAESGKLGVLLFQFPPGFHLNPRNEERLRWVLSAFKGYAAAVELRHRSWSDRGRESRRLLEGAGATWVVIDEPKFASSVEQEFEPLGDMFYLRLHGRNQKKWWSHQEPWERYDYFYGAEEIRSLADRVRAVSQKSPEAKIYVFFNNHARGQAVANALLLKHELGQEITAEPPPALVQAYPQLEKIRPLS